MLDNNTFQHIEETISYQLSSIKPAKPELIRISPNNPDYDKIQQIHNWIYHNTYDSMDTIINDMVIFGFDINNLDHWEHYRDEIIYQQELLTIGLI